MTQYESSTSAQQSSMNTQAPQALGGNSVGGSCDDVITQLNPNDVLFGRGSGPNDHEGNIRFRSLVGERKSEYMATNHRQTKAKIAREIVNAVIEQQGRFLKKLEGTDAKQRGVPKGTDAWIIADDETIMEKAKQALRQHREKDKEKDRERSPRNSPTQSKSIPKGKPPPVSLDDTQPNPCTSGDPYPSSSTMPRSLGRHHQHVVSSMNSLANTMESPLSGAVYGHGQAGQIHQFAHPPSISTNPYDPLPFGHEAQNQAQLHNWVIPVATPPQGAFPYGSALQQMSHHPANQRQIITDQMPPPARLSELTSGGGNRRESIQVHELQNLQSSFEKMKTRENMQESGDTMGTLSRDHESTDTMGTIEPLPMYSSREGGSAYGAGSSMSSSTLSMIKGLGDSSKHASSTDRLLRDSVLSAGTAEVTGAVPETSAADQNQKAETRTTSPFRRASLRPEDLAVLARRAGSARPHHDMSMSFSQLTEKRQNYIESAIDEEDEEEHKHRNKRNGAATKEKLADVPRPVNLMEDEPDNMSALGKSSMSILHIAMGEDSGLSAAHESIFSDIGDEQ